MPKMQSFNSNSEIYADFGLLRGEICKWLFNDFILVATIISISRKFNLEVTKDIETFHTSIAWCLKSFV